MKQKAFSLLELTIVLVIVGILLTAVIRGRSVIESLKMKKDFSEHLQRLYEDFYKYSTLSVKLKGYESVLGDSVENGGYESSPDGFVDHDVPAKTVDFLLGLSGNFSEVKVLYDYDGTKLPYAKNSGISSYIRTVDPDFFNEFRAGGHYYAYTASDGSEARVWFGADESGSKTGNLIVVCVDSVTLARFYDKMIDGRVNGEEGRAVLLGYKYSGCAPETTANCRCGGGTCVGRGMREGCKFPTCSPQSLREVCLGVAVGAD